MERSTEFRRKQKEQNPAAYKEYLNKQKIKSKERRENAKKALLKKPSEEVIEKRRRHLQLQRERQRRYIQTKTLEKDASSIEDYQTKQKVKRQLTRNAVQSKKEYNREKKQNERANMSSQKKVWIKKKDRERKAKQRALEKKERGVNDISGANVTITDTPFPSKKTEWNTTSKVRSFMPSTPVKFAVVVKNLIKKTTPRKKEALEKIGVHKMHQKTNLIDDTVESLKKSKEGKSALKIIAKKLVNSSSRYLARKLMLNRRTIKNIRSAPKPRHYKIDRGSVRHFYYREDISRVLPQRRYATKDGPGYAMQVSIEAACSLYKTETGRKVSLATFASLRPKNVRTIHTSHRDYCCCTYCINIRYKLLSLSRAVGDKNKKNTNERDIFQILLCQKSDSERFNKPECINGTCTSCHDYRDTLSRYYSDVPADKEMVWNRWESQRGQDGNSKKQLVTKRGKKKDLLEELVGCDIEKPAQGTSFLQHLHVAVWQNKQFENIKTNLPENCTLQVLDFAKNREIKYQDEIKSAFYTSRQVTLHPVVTFYRDECNTVTRESSIVISEDNQHDYHAVHHFLNMVDEHIVSQLGQEPVKKYVFSDGCSSQYKSKGPFADLAFDKGNINRNFYGSEHGKGDCDAEIGVLNRAVDRAIIGRKVIMNSAAELYNYCKLNLEMDEPFYKRKFFFVKDGEIVRNRKETEVKTLPKTRKFHQILNVRETIGSTEAPTLKVRNLSCFCRHCEEGARFHICVNSSYVDVYETKQLIATRPIPVVNDGQELNEQPKGKKSGMKNKAEDALDEQPKEKRSRTKNNVKEAQGEQSKGEKTGTKNNVKEAQGEQSKGEKTGTKKNVKEAQGEQSKGEKTGTKKNVKEAQGEQSKGEKTGTKKNVKEAQGEQSKGEKTGTKKNVKEAQGEQSKGEKTGTKNNVKEAQGEQSKGEKTGTKKNVKEAQGEQSKGEKTGTKKNVKEALEKQWKGKSSRTKNSVEDALDQPNGRRQETKNKECEVKERQSFPKCTASNTFGDTGMRTRFFELKLEELQKIKTYAELETQANILFEDCIDKYGHATCIPDANVVKLKLVGDSLAQAMIPNEWASNIAVRVFGDGNCLARSGSILAFGQEEWHIEIRYRLILELVINSELYLNTAYVNKGVKLPPLEATSLATTYAMFSEHYTPGDVMSTSVIRRIFRAEVMSILNRNTFMGIWQVMALSSVLGCRLHSVYPNLGHGVCQMTLNRLVLPRQERCCHTAVIMWTSNREDMVPSNWVPNHFVPVLPLQEPQQDLHIDGLDYSMTDSLQELIDSDLVSYLISSLSSEGEPLTDMIDEKLTPDIVQDLPNESDVYDKGYTPAISTDEAELRYEVEPVVVTKTPDTRDISTDEAELRYEVEPVVVTKTPDTRDISTDEAELRYEVEPVVVTKTPDTPDISTDEAELRYEVEPVVVTKTPDTPDISTDEAELRFPVGTNILVSVGSVVLKAVVVQTPDDYLSADDLGQWVQYYKKAKRNQWTLDDKPFFVLWKDTVKVLDEPSMSMSGSRLYYIF